MKRLLLSFFLCAFVQSVQAAYIPLNISSGYNADVIVNGVGTGLTTSTSDVDGANYAFVALGWQQTATSTPLAWGLPASGIVNSAVAATPGLSFNLASYSSNNSARILTNSTSATLVFSNNVAATNIYVLATSGSGISYFTGQVNFTDGTNQPISTALQVPDWFFSTAQPIALQGFGRINRSSNVLENSTTDPRLYQIAVAILPANQTKQIASLQVTKATTSATGSVLNVFAVSAATNYANDATLPALITPTGNFCAGSQQVKVVIKNNGNNNIVGAQINWKLNTVTQTPYSYTGTLVPSGAPSGNNTDTVVIGTANFPAGANNLVIWTTVPNGVADGYPANDTLTTVLTPANFTLTSTADTVCGSGTATMQLSPSTGYAANALQWQVSTDNGGTWSDIAAATATSYAATGLTASRCYRVKINTGGTNCFSPVKCIRLDTVAILTNTPGSRCGTGTVVLAATARPGNTIKWYTAATGGTAIGTGNSFTTPSISATTTYYAEAAIGATSSGCVSATRTAVIATVNPAPTVNLGNDTFLCPSATITLNATNAGSTYLWSNGATTPTINVTTAGTYHVAVTGTNSCVKRDTIVISAGTNPTNPLPSTANLCQGSSLTLNAGNAGSTYIWSTGATTQTLNVTAAGNYSVTIKNTQGCSITTPGTAVSVIPSPVVNLGNDTSICATGTLTLNATNAGAGYSWNTGATTPTINVTAAGTYRVTVTGSNGCIKRDTIIVTLKPTPTNVLPSALDLCQGSSTTLNAANTGATYLWSNGATTQSINVTTGGTYSVTITNPNGCARTTPGTVVTMRALPVVNLGPDTVICNSSVYVLNAGNPGATYQWSTGATTQTIQPLNTGSYNVEVTNSYTCKGHDTVQVSFYGNPSVDGFNFIPLFNQQLGLIKFSALNPQYVTGYSWDFGDGSAPSTVSAPTHLYTQSGQYNVTLTTTNDCGTMDTSLVIEVDLLTTSVRQVNPALAGIKLYPNPVQQGTLTVENTSSGVHMDRVQVVNILGQVVMDVKATTAAKQYIVTADLANGTYMIRIYTDKGMITRKVQVNR